MFHLQLFSIDTGHPCYENGFRNLVDMVGNVEKPDIRFTNMVAGKYWNKCARPVEQSFEMCAWEKNNFSRNLGNLIPVIVTEEHFPVALIVFEIMTTPRFP